VLVGKGTCFLFEPPCDITNSAAHALIYLSIPLPQTIMSFDDISRLCSAHSELELFLWLTNSVSGHGLNLVEQQTATALKERVIGLINHGLAQSEALKLDHDYIKRDRNLRAIWLKKKKTKQMDEIMVTDFMSVTDSSFHRTTFEMDLLLKS